MRIWLVFGFCAAGILGLIALLTWAGEKERRYRDDLQTAIGRIDNRFSLMLAREAERPHTDYEAFPFLGGEAYTALHQKIEQKEIRTPSPLLAAQPDHVRLYFQIDSKGSFTSPQVPRGSFSEFADMPAETQAGNAQVLEHIQSVIDPATLGLKLAEAEKNTEQQVAWVKAAKKGGQARTGSIEPIWLGGELYCARRVDVGREHYLQGFLFDWKKLSAALLEEVADLFSGASLKPANGGEPGWRLHTLPAFFDAPRPAGAFGGRTYLPWAIGVLLIGALAVAFRTTVEYGKKQRRFASLVTHELRSPLTTFRLYADLLAEGMVTDPEKREDYLKTLQKESGQMARMVENVIVHARIEEGRATLQLERVTVGALLEKIEPDLRRFAASLAIDAGGVHEVTVNVDTEAVGQILGNLVENAAKYGAPPVEITAAVRDGAVRLRVRDHGPGVPSAVARRIFNPFERAGRGETEPVRGLGLGLTLSRGLARDLGGDLALDPPPDGGARFVLTLPVVPTPLGARKPRP